jgi:cysteine desulfurase / selenocysteine lyase
MTDNKLLSASLINKLRDDTLGCKQFLHLNNAGASMQPHQVVRAVIHYLEQEELIGGYELATNEAEKLNDFYSQAAKLLNASPDEIAFFDSATRAWLAALDSLNLQANDSIIICDNDYGSNEMAYQKLKAKGVEIRQAATDKHGNLNLDDLVKQIDPSTKLLAFNHIPSCNGIINPVEKIGALANKHNVIFLLDACQSLGHLPIDVKQIGCHMLSATGRKYLRAPRGTGLLYVDKALLLKLTPKHLDIHGASMQSNVVAESLFEQKVQPVASAIRYELFEQNMALKRGITEALSYANALDLAQTFAHIQTLAMMLREGLSKLDGFKVTDLGNAPSNMSGIVCCYHEQIPSAKIKLLLAEQHIHCSTSLPDSGYQLFAKHQWPELVRFSIHYYNTEQEIEHLIIRLTALIEGQRSS